MGYMETTITISMATITIINTEILIPLITSTAYSINSMILENSTSAKEADYCRSKPG